MKVIENTTAYKCEFCGRMSLRRHNMESHERSCRKNPKNRPMCNNCTHHIFDGEQEEISADDILSIEIVEEKNEDELVEIVELGKKIQCLLSKLSGHRHVVITEDDVILYDEGMSLFHSDPF